MEDNQLLSEERIFRKQFRLASGQIGECTERKRSHWWLSPSQNVFLKCMEAD
jgi:hypothetical protein